MCDLLSVGNNGQFTMDSLSGLISRGTVALDRETRSSHVLEVEAYNSDQGSMRSSVRVGLCVKNNITYPTISHLKHLI